MRPIGIPRLHITIVIRALLAASRRYSEWGTRTGLRDRAPSLPGPAPATRGAEDDSTIRVRTLTRYFSILALALVVLAGGALVTLVRQHDTQQLEGLAEDRNVAMTKVFRNLLADELKPLLEASLNQRGTPPTGGRDMADLQGRIAALMRDSDVAKLKFYNAAGRTVFSTDATQIGEDKSGNGGFVAALNDKVASELTHRDTFSAYDGALVNVDLFSSYVPISEDGQVVAVFELYQDVTLLMRRMDQSQRQIWAIVLVVLGMLYLMLLLLADHGRRALSALAALLEAANRELDRRVAERTRDLQQSEARIRELLREQELIFDNAHVGIFLLRNRRILKSNQRIADMFGFAHPKDYQGESTAILYCSSQAFEAAGREGYSQLETQGYANLEVEMCRRDGTRIWVLQTGRPLDSAAVLKDASIWVYTDITERKRAESELSIAAAAFESQESMLVTDANNVILRVNKAFADCTGYTAEEVIGKTPQIFKSGRHDRKFFAAMWQSIKRTGSWQGEIWDRRKNGEVYPKWLTISAVKGQDGVVTHYVGAHTDITERKIAEGKINQLAFFDQLTGLPNRTLFLDRLRQAMIACERSGAQGALLFLDLDHFKALNDTMGHDQGDTLLKQVAQLLTENVRQGDTVARLGGDEFVIVLGGLEQQPVNAATDVEAVCRKLLAALKQDLVLERMEFHSSASIGVTLFTGQQTSIEDLLKQADMAMYRSKEAGRNTFTFFDPTMEETMLARALVEADLRRAIHEQQFVLHYQPQVDSANGRIVGAEALVRWRHPSRGLVSPGEFIPAAEETGMILPLGRWVLESACATLATWAQQPETAHLTIAVNVSAHQFRQIDFVDQVIAAIDQHKINPRRLELELTESIFVDSVEDVIVKMAALKTRGVGFSLDDFGTGYSSLAYLSRLPLDQLKIDRSFVMNLESSHRNAAICAATISLAHNLALKVVAEGVETNGQRDFLSKVHHCNLLQGYLLGRPMPLVQFEALVNDAGPATRSTAEMDLPILATP
jgi:diguanylate cyclase (GGDEF)-like protein/PAS domain S-box-containing protein